MTPVATLAKVRLALAYRWGPSSLCPHTVAQTGNHLHGQIIIFKSCGKVYQTYFCLACEKQQVADALSLYSASQDCDLCVYTSVGSYLF